MDAYISTVKFLQKYKALENRICSLCGQEADGQLRNLCTAYNLPSGSSASKIIDNLYSPKIHNRYQSNRKNRKENLTR